MIYPDKYMVTMFSKKSRFSLSSINNHFHSSTIRNATVFFQVLHNSYQRIILDTEIQLLVKAQIIFLHTLNSYSLELQPSKMLLLVKKRIKVEFLHPHFLDILFFCQKEIHVEFSF